MTKLEIESSMDADDMEEEILQAQQVRCCQQQCEENVHDCIDELHLNCVDLELREMSAIAKLFHCIKEWKSIEVEECTGQVDLMLSWILAQSLQRLKLVAVLLEEFDRTVWLALAVGLSSNPHLRELTLSCSLSAHDASILAQGLSCTSLSRLCLWDCRLDTCAAIELARGLRQAVLLQEFGLVACDLCEERLDILLRALADHPALTRLDLRCLASSITPVGKFVLQNSNISILDLSFRSVQCEEAIDIPTLANAIRHHASLTSLHLCSNLLSDDNVETLLDALSTASESCCLSTLDLSMNAISDSGLLHTIAPRIANNQLKIRRLLLENNDFSESALLQLVQAMTTNTYLEEVGIPHDFAFVQQMLDYYGRLNRGGRRLVVGSPPQEIALALWPFVLERVNRLKWDQQDRTSSNGTHEPTLLRAEILYCLLHGPLFFPV